MLPNLIRSGMSINEKVNYKIVHTSFSFAQRSDIVSKIKDDFPVEIPFLEFGGVSEDIKEAFDTYLYIEDTDNFEETFRNLAGRFAHVRFSDLGPISGEELVTLVKSCEDESVSNIIEGEYYQIASGPLRNLIVKCISPSIEDKFVKVEYEILGEIKVDLISINNLSNLIRQLPETREYSFMSLVESAKDSGFKRAICIDGSYVLHREIHGYHNMYTSKNRRFIGGCYGFYFTLLKLKELWAEFEIHVIFDGYDKEKFEKNTEYKKNRTVQTNRFREAYSDNRQWIKNLSEALGFHLYHLLDKEGDDVIGSVAFTLESQGYDRIHIYSIDTDFFQLVTPTIFLDLPKPTLRGHPVRVGVEEALQEFGVNRVEKINWFRALQGDSSDNIPSINIFYKKNGISIPTIQSKEYLPFVNEADTIEDLIYILRLNPKFIQFAELGQFDRNLQLLTINRSIFNGQSDPLESYENSFDENRCLELLEQNAFYKELESWNKNSRIFRGLW